MLTMNACRASQYQPDLQGNEQNSDLKIESHGVDTKTNIPGDDLSLIQIEIPNSCRSIVPFNPTRFTQLSNALCVLQSLRPVK